jgi:hypothetical protein
MTKTYIRFIYDQLSWIEWKHPWLNDGEIPANNLNDFRPKNNDISIYEFENEQQLTQIAAAYGVQRQKIDNLDYVCFSPDALKSVNLVLKQENGKTPDQEVNKLHINLIHLSAEKIVILAHKLLENGKTGRLYEKELFERIAENIKLGRIPGEKLPPNIKRGLEKWDFSI